MKKFLSLFALVYFSLSAMANGVLIDCVYYILDASNQTASVTYPVWPKNGSDPISTPQDLYTGDVVIPSSVTYLDTVYSVTSIGDNAFFGSRRMTSISIPNSVTSVGYKSFCFCTGLKELVFPESLTTMGVYNYTGDMGNVYIACLALTPPTVVNPYDLGAHMTTHVPAEAVAAYRSAFVWSGWPIAPLMLEAERTALNSVDVKWSPVKNTDTYELGLEVYRSDTLVMTDTLYIAADAANGGTLLSSTSATQRIHRVIWGDEIGTLVVIVFDDNTGTTTDEPFVATVSTTKPDVFQCKVRVIAYHDDQILRQDRISFKLNELDAALPSTSISSPVSKIIHNGIIIIRNGEKFYDLTGNRIK